MNLILSSDADNRPHPTPIRRPAGRVPMLVLSNPTPIKGVGDAELRRLLQHRVDALQEFDDYALGDLVRFVVVEPGDSLQDLDAQLGFSARDKPFELLEEHPGYYELVFVVSDDGFGIEVFIPKHPGIDPQLLAICATQEKSD